jgi:hypothetical protein
MKDKTIAELIHDRVFAEGGTLNVWLSGAKFRKLTTRINARTCHSATAEESMDCLVEFKPSPELATMIARNADELRGYLSGIVRNWAAEVSARRSRPAGSARVLSGGFEAVSQRSKGPDICDCHGGMRSAISERGRKITGAAVIAAVFVVLQVSDGLLSVFSEIGGGARDSAAVGGVEMGQRSSFKVERPGVGSGCSPRRLS